MSNPGSDDPSRQAYGGLGGQPERDAFASQRDPRRGGPVAARKNRTTRLWIVFGVLAVVGLGLGVLVAWLTTDPSGESASGTAVAVTERTDAPATPAPTSPPATTPADTSTPVTSTPATTSPVTSTPATTTSAGSTGLASPPAGAQECSPAERSTSGLRSSATGTGATSCAFAEEVRQAYTRAGSDLNARTVEAVSPVTGERYDMTCEPSRGVIACTGGNNALVYLF